MTEKSVVPVSHVGPYDKSRMQDLPAKKRWELIKEDWIAQNLRLMPGEPAYTLKQLAAAWGIAYVVIRQMSSKHKWGPQLKERLAKLQEETHARLHEVALFDEIEIRTRQATYARLASSIAFQKLQTLDEKAIKNMSVKDAVELLKIGLGEERQALGIGDVVATPKSPEDRAVLSEKQVFAVARRVLEMRKQADGSYAQRDNADTTEQPSGEGTGEPDHLAAG